MERQLTTYEALKDLAPYPFPERYLFGMQHWNDVTKMAELDSWMREMDEVNNSWLRALLRAHRAELLVLQRFQCT